MQQQKVHPRTGVWVEIYIDCFFLVAYSRSSPYGGVCCNIFAIEYSLKEWSSSPCGGVGCNKFWCVAM